MGLYEGGSVHNLSDNATDDPVDVEDVCQYVQKYAELRLLKIVEGPLKVGVVYTLLPVIHNLLSFQAMKAGLNDVLPGHVLEGLTAEELRMLLCGCQLVELETLRKITTFTDESSKWGSSKSNECVMVGVVSVVMVRIVSSNKRSEDGEVESSEHIDGESTEQSEGENIEHGEGTAIGVVSTVMVRVVSMVMVRG